MTTINFPPFSAVEAYIDIYPFEGGKYTLTGGALLNLTTSKSIRGTTGAFSATLAPDFVVPNSYLSWPQIITPMSLAVIGMRHGTLSSITMIGVVTGIAEVEVWNQSSPVQRSFTIQGADLAYFFTMPDYFTLWYLAVLEGSNANAQATVGAGLVGPGDPGQLGKTWYNQIMASGVFANTFVNFLNGPVTFQSIFGTEFDKYDVNVPYGDYFLGNSGSWFEAFQRVFPFPFYEFFVTTGTQASYPGTSQGQQFYSQELGSSVTGNALVVARINPLPQLTATPSGGIPKFTGIDTSKWSALPEFDLMGLGPLESSPVFTDAGVSNVFLINPTWATGMGGSGNNTIVMPIYQFSICVDKASVNRYGYRPNILNLAWMFDGSGQFAQGQGSGALPAQQALYSTLYARFAGYYEPNPLMCSSTVKTILRPDIFPGCRFSYVPFRTEEPWDFYITGVNHNWVFGGESTTSLTLERGLPESVYGDNVLLFNIHTGNAQRVNGMYQSGLPTGSATGLAGLSPQALAQWMGTLNTLYSKAQGTQ